MSELSKIDSTISFLAEEGGKIDGASEWCWVIDPLDGTTNFAKQVPYFCISIALTYKQEPQLGVIYAPLAKELFVAFKGGGSFLNGASIHVSDAELKDSLIAVSFPYSCSQNFMDDLHNVQKVLSYVAGVRVMGAAALDLAGVAAGRFDGAFFHGLRWWDIAAGMVLLQESGAKIANFEGGAIDPNFNSFVAATPKIFKHLHDILNK